MVNRSQSQQKDAVRTNAVDVGVSNLPGNNYEAVPCPVPEPCIINKVWDGELTKEAGNDHIRTTYVSSSTRSRQTAPTSSWPACTVSWHTICGSRSSSNSLDLCQCLQQHPSTGARP